MRGTECRRGSPWALQAQQGEVNPGLEPWSGEDYRRQSQRSQAVDLGGTSQRSEGDEGRKKRRQPA
jgi:hypothetical protein